MANKKLKLKNENGNYFSNAYVFQNNTCYTLVSYTTPMCKIWLDQDVPCEKFERIAYPNTSGIPSEYLESRTTMRQINCFRRDHNMPPLKLAEWRKM